MINELRVIFDCQNKKDVLIISEIERHFMISFIIM